MRARLGKNVVFAWVRAPKPLCFHLDGFRCDGAGAVKKPKCLPPVAIHGYWKHPEPPGADEPDVVPVDFAMPAQPLRYY